MRQVRAVAQRNFPSLDDMVADSIERLRQADDEAHASHIAWLAGPDKFMELMHARHDKIRERIDSEYQRVLQDVLGRDGGVRTKAGGD